MTRDEQNPEPPAGDPPDPFSPDPWEPAPGSIHSIGEYLKSQRQLRGISQEELCQLTRIPPRSLERLEAGAFDALDDGFVRGFVRTVAEALGLDPDDTLARMSPEPEAEGDRMVRVPGPGLLRLGVLVTVLGLLLVSLGVVRAALDAVPDPEAVSAVVVRMDPVRALAEEVGVAGLATTEVLVPNPARRRRPDDTRGPVERPPIDGPVMRAGAPLPPPGAATSGTVTAIASP